MLNKNILKMKIIRIYLLSILTIMVVAQPLLAQEGTRQLMPGGTGICYVALRQPEFAREGGSAGGRLYVTLKAGEKLLIGMKLFEGDATKTTFRIKRPNGVDVAGFSRQAVPSSGNGFITNAAALNNGPNGAILNGTAFAGGYTPLSFTAPEAGDYYIEFQIWTDATFTTVDVSSSGAGASTSFEFFEVTVTDASNNVITNPGTPTVPAGRMWSKMWGLNSTAFAQFIKSSFYVYTSDGFVNKLTPDMGPFVFLFLSNTFGTNNTADATANRKSFRGNAFATKDITEHKIFLNDPDISLYPNSTIKPVVKIWFNNTLIFDFDYQRTPQQLALTPATIPVQRNGTVGCPHESMAFLRVESNINGQMQLALDVNNNGFDFATASPDVTLFANIENGVTYLPWDIKDKQGNNHANGASFNGRVNFLMAGITHFPFYDVENCEAVTAEAVRPYNRLGATLYWDDTDIEANGGTLTVFAGTAKFQLSNPPTTTLRKWVFNNAGGDPNNGNLNTMNAWFAGLDFNNDFTYSVSSPDICTNFDRDRDKKFDLVDLDDDNDGIPDVIEAGGTIHPNIDLNGNKIPDWREGTTTIDPSIDNDADGRWNYEDADITAFIDRNGDGVNDNFDKDRDGVPDIFDLDSDNDGISDFREGGGVAGTLDKNNNGAVDKNNATADGTIAGGANGSLLADVLDVDKDGIPDAVDPVIFGGTPGTPLGNYTIATGVQIVVDTDSDGLINAQDMDTDNDGIPDLIEAQVNAAKVGNIVPNNPPVAFSNTDTDKDGFDDAYDTFFSLQNSTSPFGVYGAAITGVNISPINTDAADNADYMDENADNDASPDFIEGIDDNTNGYAYDDYIKRAADFETANNSIGFYTTTDSDNNGIPNWLEGTKPVFLVKTSPFYKDSDNDGLVDLFDTFNKGVAYGGTATGQPDQNTNGNPNYRDITDVPSLRCVTTITGVVSISANQTTIIRNQRATITATGASRYTWTPAASIVTQNANGSVIEVAPTTTTWYVMLASDANGCTKRDSILITVNEAPTGDQPVLTDIFIPSLFSPNGDGNNDRFIIAGQGIVEIDLKVFDRAGNLLYRTQDFTEATTTGWDGRFRGEIQPVSMYIWTINGKFADGRELSYQGNKSGQINLIK
ncbi:MAG: gliding motility-associated C-terminal domain-containing protein [Cytophagales bacterium]|nr:MAG: gliding motility-associated C-terminal domain-containing protein [Cytophagales bacterium]